MELPVYQMSFDGSVLERGFWLYVWRISKGADVFFYIGRTGDSSSANAASPFNRIGQHLNFRPNAKGNSMARNLEKAGITPRHCDFKMIAMGPIYQEQESFSSHKPLRDKMASLEWEAAKQIRACGGKVIGTHHRKAEPESNILASVSSSIKQFINENGC